MCMTSRQSFDKQFRYQDAFSYLLDQHRLLRSRLAQVETDMQLLKSGTARSAVASLVWCDS